MIKKISDNTAQVCCSANCPFVSIDGEVVSVRDDFGGRITLSVDEALELSDAVLKIKSWKNLSAHPSLL